ncbi:MAG TPA: substrate-binding domain-containing protein [Metabacillus sp.]|nr:substrate-binding domain-containing protein [Metabacillus sp.]
MKKVTMADVAKQANVSKSTVSQFLNKRYDYMSDETKIRIEEAINKLGYKPNIIARSLKQKSTSTIGVIVANILHAFSTQVIRAIEDTCHEQDFHIIVCNADDDSEKEKRYIDMLRAKQVDGLIIFPTAENVDMYKSLVREEYPIVFMDRNVPELTIPSIMLDNEKAASLAVQHFIDQGYKRIGMITTSVRNVTTRIERINGFRNTLQKNGLIIQNEYIQSVEVTQIQEALKTMLSLEAPPQAILAGNDMALMEILKYVKENDIEIPSDLALIGIDDVSFASFYNPSLTTVAQPTFKMGAEAANVLLQKIRKQEGNENEGTKRFEPELIIRKSC